MSTAYLVVTVLAALMAGFSAWALHSRQEWVVGPLTEYGVPRPWWPWLAAAKAAGALGLLAGLAVRPAGIAAAAGLALYFAGAAVTVLRARSYAHVPFPLVYAAPAVASLALL
ncbi:DoxX family protein [Streptomyces sp. NPDC093094]|uniref:DoxX family protein n=1 Tax=Streptomyces sp. NPDC093094 TaxID=3366026 RepID=UPI0037FF6152